MFVLDRILRNLSESNKVIVSSFYEEMISKIEEWRNEKIVDSEYHEVRPIVLVLPIIYKLYICTYVEAEIASAAVFEGVHK